MRQRPGEKPRILHCIPVLGGGGAERQLRNLLVYKSSPNVEHAVFAWKTGEFHDELRALGVPIFLEQAKGRRPWHPITSMIRAILKWKPTILQAWLPQTDVMAGGLGAIFRIPVVGSERNSSFLHNHVPEIKNRWFTRLRPWFLRHCVVGVIANSHAGARYIRDELKVGVPVKVIPNGLDLGKIDAMEPRTPPPFENPELSPKILAASRLVSYKRVEVIIDAMAILRDKGIRPALAICGSGEASDFLQQRIDELKLGDQIRMLGQCKDVPGIMKRAQVFCTASENEGMPNSMLEAMTCGLAIVASDIPEHVDLIGDVDVGPLFKKGSPEDLAARLAEIITTPGKIEALGANAAAYGKEFPAERMAGRFEEFYQEMFPDLVRL
ncbi:glycosyltransferase [Singulisphaera rosea]